MGASTVGVPQTFLVTVFAWGSEDETHLNSEKGACLGKNI
jgi:hypothetical protein